jgi:hypothetical protein
MLSSQLPSLHHSLVTSFTPFTRHLSLLSSACSHHSHRQLSPSGPPPVLPLIICLSSALVTSTISSLFSGHLLLLFHPSTVSHLNSRLHQSQHLFITPLATSSRPFTRHLSLLSPASSHYSHRQLIIPWPPPLHPPLVMCLSSHYHALITAIPAHHSLGIFSPPLTRHLSSHQHALITAIASSSSPGHLHSSFHSSYVSHLIIMLCSQPLPAHHSLGIFSHPFTRHLSLLSSACSHHSDHQLIIPWNIPSLFNPYLSLISSACSHYNYSIILPSFPGHLFPTFHSPSFDHLIIMLTSQPSRAPHAPGHLLPTFHTAHVSRSGGHPPPSTTCHAPSL